MIDQDSGLTVYAGRIVATGCGYLNEEHFVAEAVSNLVPFEVPRLKLENQDSAWAIAWRIASAWFWCGSAIFLTIQLAILISAQPEMHDRAEELVNVVGAFWSWLVTYPCLAFAGVALVLSSWVSAPVLDR